MAMDTFEVFTIGNAYFLDKIFNAIRLIFASGFTGILKIAVAVSLGMLAVKSMMTSNFKESAKWMIGVVVLTSVFLNTKAKIVIHDSLPDQLGRIQAAYIVDDVPWGLAWIASATSTVGKSVMTKFESAFSGTTNNQTYRKYGILFGSKVIEDANRIRISNPDLRSTMLKFYRQCIVPDLKMGHTRKNGYTLKELAETEDIGEFLKDHASNARSIYIAADIQTKHTETNSNSLFEMFRTKTTSTTQSTIDGYVSCNKAAHIISDMVDYELESNKALISRTFVSQFMGNDVPAREKNIFFEAVLKDTYSSFLKSSKDASDILKQNIMINSIKDSASSVAHSYANTLTEEMTRSSMYSVSQVFQKFIPIIRSVFECLFYGVAPLVLILMVTPIGLEVLKNYAFSFLYLQMWPPMYAILYVITESWSRFSSSGLKHNMKSLPQIEAINYDIAMVSGYMLALIPVLSMFITKGLVASVGNMATSMMYIPQTAATNAAEQSVRGNYSFGTTNMDNHSYDNLNAHKLDDNYSWMSGMKSFQQVSGATIKQAFNDHQMVDLSGATHNLGNLANINWSQAIGTRLDESETTAQKEMESASKDYVSSISSGMSKVLGYDTNYSRGTSSYEAINKSLTHDNRESLDSIRGVTDRISHDNGMTSNDVLRMAVAAQGGINFFGNGVSASISAENNTQKTQAWNQVQDAVKDHKFSEALSKVESIGKNSNIQTQDSETESVISSMRSDFNKAESSSSRLSHAREQMHSIQESRSNYENQGRSIDLNLNNKFADWAVEKFGTEKFEDMALSNPQEFRDVAQIFLKEELGSVGQYKFASISSNNLSLDSKDYDKIQDHHKANNQTLDVASNGLVENMESKRTELLGLYSEEDDKFVSTNQDKNEELAHHKSNIAVQAHNREQQDKQRINELAAQQMGQRIIKTFTKEDK